MSDLYTHPEPAHRIGAAEASIEQVYACGAALARAQEAEALAVLERHAHRTALRDSLVGQVNPVTGKAHSATSALDAAEEQETYRDRVRECARTVRATQEAWAAYEVAKLRARLAVEAVAVGGAL